MHQYVSETIVKEKIIVIFRGVKREKLIPLAKAMYAGGIRLVEVTFDAAGRVTDRETADSILQLTKALGDKMLIGGGTVLKPEQAALVKNAGGTFVISPDADAGVIKKTRELGMVSMPGALTPGEIRQAYDMGADFVKIFPASQLGPAYIRAIRAPLAHIPLTAVGGIDETNMQAYLEAGVTGFGIGANIVNRSLIEREDYDGITRLAEKYTEAIREWQTT